jgi:hypothetical protein
MSMADTVIMRLAVTVIVIIACVGGLHTAADQNGDA